MSTTALVTRGKLAASARPESQLAGSKDDFRSLERLTSINPSHRGSEFGGHHARWTSTASSSTAGFPLSLYPNTAGSRSLHSSRLDLASRSTSSSSGLLAGSEAGDVYYTRDGSRKVKSIGSLLGPREPNTTGVFKARCSKKEEHDIYSIKFSPNDDYLLYSLGNADIQVFSLRTNSVALTLSQKTQKPSLLNETLPCVCIAFKPELPTDKTHNIVTAAYADGRVMHWHYTTGQLLGTIDEGDNQINCIDYFPVDGSRFATVGSDCCVRIYDSSNLALIASLVDGRSKDVAGHSNRVFSVKFHPLDSNVVISAGWDNTIQIWDIRAERSVRSIYGPQVYGDALDFDITGENVLTGSYSREDNIQIWSFSTGELVDTIPWTLNENRDGGPTSPAAATNIPAPAPPGPAPATLVIEPKRTCMLYSAQFSRGSPTAGPHHIRTPLVPANRWIVAGGGGGGGSQSYYLNEVKMFSRATKRAIGMVQGFQHALFSVALSHSDRTMACGGGGKTLYLYDVDPMANQDFTY